MDVLRVSPCKLCWYEIKGTGEAYNGLNRMEINLGD